MRRNFGVSFFGALFIMASAFISTKCDYAHAQEFTKPMGYVSDSANLLSKEEAGALRVELAKYEAKTANELVVATVPSLNGSSVEEFARDLSNRLSIGKHNKHNGVLLLVAPSERKVRIAVGDGLKATLTDRVASRIIEENIVPKFRKNRLSDGVFAGVHSIMQTLDAARVTEAARARSEAISDAMGAKFPEFGILILAIGGMFLALIISWLSIRSV